MNHAQLKDEIQNDPLKLGYAEMIQSGSDLGIANVLNDATGAGSATIILPSIGKTAFLGGILPALLVLATKDATTQQKWDRILGVVQSVESIDLTLPIVAGLLGVAIAEGLLTQEHINGFTQRTGSRAEVLFGAGTVVAHTDVAAAFGRGIA